MTSNPTLSWRKKLITVGLVVFTAANCSTLVGCTLGTENEHAGQKISLIDNENYKYFLYAQWSSTPQTVSSSDRLKVMSTWATDTFTITYSGWYNITMAKSDMSEFDKTFIATQTLADYIYIE